MAAESRRTVIEPTRVIGPLRTARQLDDDELFRPAVATTAEPEAGETERGQGAESEAPAFPFPPAPPGVPEDDTQVMASVPASPRGRRRARMPLIVAASVGVGFALALALTARIVVPASNSASTGTGTTARPTVSASAQPSVSASAQAQADVLREGDSGAAVSELQTRLLRIPDVYPDGKVNGQYDAVLTAAVARFQLWYGIRGDEDGEYGDATRRDLESRTGGTSSTNSSNSSG